jgi:hypothetical protein
LHNPQFVTKPRSRLQVQKTYKLFIGGKFVRGENGRYVRRDLAAASWSGAEAENPYWILDTVEMKTAWHPIGL